MRRTLTPLVLLLLVALLGQPAPVAGSPPLPGAALRAPAEAKATVSGFLTGRVSKRPLAKAWVLLGRLTRDTDGRPTDLILTQFGATTDDKGYFQIKDVPLGSYTLVYRPAPGPPLKGGGKIAVRSLSMGIRSFMPMIRDKEVGTATPFDERQWTPEFTLLKGHTLYAVPLGGLMKIWNGSVRSGRQGPFIEMRRNLIWTQDVQKDVQVKFEAWSF